MRPLALLVTALVSTGVGSPAAAAGTIDVQTTSFSTAIVIDITVVDNGGPGSCGGYFTVRRTLIPECTATDIATFARQPGTTTSHQYFDTSLTPGRAYRYEVVSCSGFTWAVDCGWGLNIEAIAATTPAPAYLGHGRLEPGITFYSCPTECAGGDVLYLTPDAFEYVGTGAELLLYGSYVPDCQNGWLLHVTQVVPAACAIGVQPSTWTLAKSLFR
jgi:hypothetical protein